MQVINPRRSNFDRSAGTRAGLIAAARRLFVEKGYTETSTPEIASAANMTRGALYHHFADKKALFRAVAESEAAAVAAGIERAAPTGLPALDMLIRGGEAYLDAMAQPGRTRLLLLDGPAVLGRPEMDAIDGRHAAASLAAGLGHAIEQGAIDAELPIGALTQLLSAAFDRAALAIETGGDEANYKAALSALIRGLAPRRET